MTQSGQHDVVARFWRSLEERAGERPADSGVEDVPEVFVRAPVSRRGFLQIMGSAIALTACTRQPEERIVPFIKAPEEVVLGRPLFYATSVQHGGFARGVLVEAHEGRPTKVEGNPEHPASLGSTDAFAQAEIMELYDPDRSQTVLHNGEISSWSALVGALSTAMEVARARRGEGLHIVTGEITSPTLYAQLNELLTELPFARWHVHEAVGLGNEPDGTRLAFGRPLAVRYHLDRVDTVLALDADFLGSAEGQPRYVRDFSTTRRAGAELHSNATMSRLYAVESQHSVTGGFADHRLPLSGPAIEHLARLVAKRLGIGGVDDGVDEAVVPKPWLDALVADLQAAGKRALVIPGRCQPPRVHALAHAINAQLGSEAVSFSEPVGLSADVQATSMKELSEALASGSVTTLVAIETNFLYDAPADLELEARIQQAKLRVHLGRHLDETASLSHWHAPAAHSLEMWSDARAYDGTINIVQPLIEPIHRGRSAHDLLAVMAGKPGTPDYDLVREHWQQATPSGFERAWRVALHDGRLANSERSRIEPSLQAVPWGRAPKLVGEGFEAIFRPDPTVYDGRYANNAWLQELPKPLSKLTWDNAALFCPSDAEALGLDNGDVVELALDGRKTTAPVWIMPGQAKGTVTLPLGYGRRYGGKVLAAAKGFNAYLLRTTAGPFNRPGLTITKTGDTYPLVSAQQHHSMEGRDLVRTAPAAAYRENPKVHTHHEHKLATLYPNWSYENRYAWGMAIDLNSCTGCSACVIACQAENNIAVVGKEEVAVGREMHWLRIDRYFGGELDDPSVHVQPIPCQQCESAPCEVVCPVQATVHHDEGLNDMVYNRCVGTKYCSNNCPYKVRRFNFFPYSTEPIAPLDPRKPTVQMSKNPDVTVRTYGVMEKCSYCVQRISYARIEAKKEDRKIRDGEVMTACQAACPAQAISFGDINDEGSVVAKHKAEPRNYGILTELNTRPRTTYLAHLSNPNPALAPADPDGKKPDGKKGAH